MRRVRKLLVSIDEKEGPPMLHVRIEPGNVPSVPLLLHDPDVLAARFIGRVTEAQQVAT
jgi:hypothetical protein